MILFGMLEVIKSKNDNNKLIHIKDNLFKCEYYTYYCVFNEAGKKQFLKIRKIPRNMRVYY